MKKSTKLVSAVVVLAVLGGTYVGLNTYVSKEEKTESSSEEESKTEVFSVKTDDIKSLEFIVDKKETTFEKKDDSWVKKDETAFPVNQTTLDSAASAIEKVEADRVLKKVDDLTEYGLDSPSNTITVDTSDGTTKFNIGDENTSTNQYYITKDDDDNTVYVVAASTVTPFMDSLYDYAQGIQKTDDVRDTVTIDSILTTSDKAYSKTNMQSSNIEKEDGDVDGPFDLGVAITEKLDDDKETQIVYYSTAHLMESQVNQMVSGGNEKLLLESLNWMTSTDDSNSVSIPSKSLESTSLTVTDYDAAFWKICTIGLIPGVFLVAGFLIWLKRRKA